MRRALLSLLCTLTLCAPAVGRAEPEEKDLPLDAATRREVIDNTLKALTAEYVFPDVAREMEKAVRARVKRGEYEKVTSGRALAEKLTEDLDAVAHDKHLGVHFSAEPLPEGLGAKAGPERREQWRRTAVRRNFGFQKVEVLPGNVGYLAMSNFTDPLMAGAGEAATAAMNFLASTDALVIDLRGNTGGSTGMVALVLSYLLDEPTHLNDFWVRATGETQQSWTLPHVPGRRHGNKPLYVLMNGRSISAAEELAYDVQQLKRGTVVGEVSAGGANPGSGERVHPHFAVFIPMGRAVNPLTKTNWEGVGVKPDVAVPEALALTTAHLRALETLRAQADAERQAELDALIAGLKRAPHAGR